MYLSGASFPLLILVGSLYLPPNSLVFTGAGDASPYTEVVLPARCLGSSKTHGAEQVHILVAGRVCRPRNLTYFFP